MVAELKPIADKVNKPLRFFSMSKRLLKKHMVGRALTIDARTLVNPHSSYPEINGLHP